MIMAYTTTDRERLRQRAYSAAANVRDPEIPVLTLADLGILREVSVGADGSVEVVILPTYMGCPAMGLIQAEVETALATAGFEHIAVRLAHSPPWSTDRMSPEAREKLRSIGIAPPACSAASRDLFAKETNVACPRCGSSETEVISEFGSTTCKSLWRCKSCREPFDHFKCS